VQTCLEGSDLRIHFENSTRKYSWVCVMLDVVLNAAHTSMTTLPSQVHALKARRSYAHSSSIDAEDTVTHHQILRDSVGEVFECARGYCHPEDQKTWPPGTLQARHH
jgi:hypothetical protein